MRWARSLAAGILLVIGVAVSPVALTGAWAKTIVTDTDAYVSAVAPLAADPDVTATLEDRLVTVVMDAVENFGAAEQVADYLSGLDIPSVVRSAIAAGLTSLTEALRAPVSDVIHEIVSSPAFADLWEQVNRVAHAKFGAIMDGNSVLLDSAGNIALQLEPVLEVVRVTLVNNGHSWASSIPPSDVQLVLVEAGDVDTVRGYYDMLDTWSTTAIIVTLCALIGAVVLARDRRRGAVRTFAALAFGMILFRLLLNFGVNALGERARNPDAVGAIFSSVTADLTDWIRSIALVSILVALIAFAWGKRAAIRAAMQSARIWLSNPLVLAPARIVGGLVSVVGAVWLLFADHQSLVEVVLVVIVVAGAAMLAAAPSRLLPEHASVRGD